MLQVQCGRLIPSLGGTFIRNNPPVFPGASGIGFMKNTYIDELSKVDLWERLTIFGAWIKRPINELYHGMMKGTFPWEKVIPVLMFLNFFLFFRCDLWLVSKTRFLWLYPRNMKLYHIYYLTFLTSPFWLWGFAQANKRERLNKSLANIFKQVGLQNCLGHIPKFIYDVPIDSTTRKLCVTRAVLPMTAFHKSKDALQGGLNIYIDEFRENRNDGTVDIIYAKKEMPRICKVFNYHNVQPLSFYIGTTRSQEILVSLDQYPHLLIAGQTGGGKSTFERQFIVTIYLNDLTAHFILIDFKGAVEADLFGKLPRVQIPHTMQLVEQQLERISKTLDYRFELFKANSCKDITSYLKIDSDKRKTVPVPSDDIHAVPHRDIIVVDEAAELFLSSDRATGTEVQHVKQVLSRVARQGRSVGVHLVLATQRPDARALDSQIKANLPGVLCFQMVNDASSILVLGNGRATDLPAIPGRAIWKAGLEMIDVQTPFLEWEEARELLKPYFVEPQNSNLLPPVEKPTPKSNQVPTQEDPGTMERK